MRIICRPLRTCRSMMQAARTWAGVSVRGGFAPRRWRAPTLVIRAYNGGASGGDAAASSPGLEPVQQFREDVKAGWLKMGLFLDSCSPQIAELAAESGWDWVLVDLQHSPASPSDLDRMLGTIIAGSAGMGGTAAAAGAAGGGGRALPLVRVAGPDDRAGIQQSLDLGARGVMVPSVEHPDEVWRAVEFMKFPPQGKRSIFYPMRPTHKTGLAPYLESANNEVYVMIQIETESALERLDEVLGVPGVDCAFVGPVDLAFSLGLHQKYGVAHMFESSEYQAAMKRVLDVCEQTGVVPGNFAFPSDRAQGLAAQGFKVLATGTDMGLLLSATSAQFEALRSITQPNGSGWQPRPSAVV